MPAGTAALRERLEGVLEKLAERVPAMLLERLRGLCDSTKGIDEQVATNEWRLRQHLAGPAQGTERRIAAVPGVALLTA